MPKFSSPYFQIDLPEATVDASSYCFALPAKGRFHPSIVIKFDKLPEKQSLGQYADAQIEKMKGQLKNFQMLGTPRKDVANRVSLTYQWGDGDSQFRQYQIFWVQGPRLFLLTGTLLQSAGVEDERLLKAALISFQPF